MDQPIPMTMDSVRELLEAAGAQVRTRDGRSEHYGAPRDFSFEVKAVFGNGLGLHILARQFSYRDPWETGGRVNDLVDVYLLRGGRASELPKGNRYFQGCDVEEGVDEAALREMVGIVRVINPKVFLLQKLTGDVS